MFSSNHLVLILTLLLLTACHTSVVDINNQLQACVLYGTNKHSGFPIPLLNCTQISTDIECNQQIINSEHANKVWRSYPSLTCNHPNIASGLTERYLLEGID